MMTLMWSQLAMGRSKGERQGKCGGMSGQNYLNLCRVYQTATGVEHWQNLMKKQFPHDTEAIDKYFELVNSCTNTFILHGVLKVKQLILRHITKGHQT